MMKRIFSVAWVAVFFICIADAASLADAETGTMPETDTAKGIPKDWLAQSRAVEEAPAAAVSAQH
jgi:hypothetical protein